MNYIVITLKANDFEKDLKIPNFITVAEFGKVIAEKYQIASSLFQVEPAGIILKPEETFSQQSVYDGAILTAN